MSSNIPNPSRRNFLSSTALATGLFATGSCANLGGSSWRTRPIPRGAKPPSVGPDETLRMAIIGPGSMGSGHMHATIAHAKNGDEKVEIVALAEVCKPRLDRALAWLSENQPGVQVEGYRDYKELLAREDIHCVLVASTEHWHAQHSIDAIASGKDVYVEKPMTLRLDEALWMRAVMEANPEMRLQVGTQYMTWGKFVEAKKLISAGRIGKPVFSQTSYCRNSPGGEWLYEIEKEVQPGEMLDWEAWCGPLGVREWDTNVYHRWRRYRDYSTGIIGDLLVHMITPMIFAIDCGWPTRVTAAGGHYVDKEMENHDQVNLTVEFQGEHTMIVAGSTCNSTGLPVLIRGHEANLELGGNNCVLRPEPPFVDDIDPVTIEADNSAPQDKLRLDWLSCVRTRAQNVSQVELATQVMVIVDLATRSMWEGGSYSFDPATLETRPIS
ncbi:MAG: putative dehydrogenase [Chlamydiales bacterium]|jgi:predicted dehydrogenase